MAGYKLNLNNPLTFNEKIQWLKLYYKNPLITKCSDKVSVREYVKDKIGEKYLTNCLGVFSTPQEINFDILPNKFVIKVNWGSGLNIIVKNKKLLNIKNTVNVLNIWMQKKYNHYYNFLEWGYKHIKPKILIENFISNTNNLLDYKFLCFNGKPYFMFIVKDRDLKDNMTVTFFDMNFNKLPFERHYKKDNYNFTKPILWNEMINISKKLSKPFPFVRVDLYINSKSIKFGELTFYPGNGTESFKPFEWDIRLGECLILPNKLT